MPVQPLLSAVVAAAAALALSAPCHAALQDEIHVFDDAISAPGDWGLELHINTTPSGRSTPDYPGEVVPRHALRVMPELALGLTPTLELGLHLPTARDAQGHWYAAGARLRLLWLPMQTRGADGLFAGLNLELSRLAGRFEATRTTGELLGIAGWRSGPWLLAANPALLFPLSDGQRGERPELHFHTKLMRELGHGLAVGLEHHAVTGPLGRRLPWGEQSQQLYLAADIEAKPWAFNVGIGRGLTDSTDRWTLKTIIEVPF